MRAHKDMCAALEPMGRPPWLEMLDLRRSVADLRRENEVSTCQYLTYPEFHEPIIPTGVPSAGVLRSPPCRSACECPNRYRERPRSLTGALCSGRAARAARSRRSSAPLSRSLRVIVTPLCWLHARSAFGTRTVCEESCNEMSERCVPSPLLGAAQKSRRVAAAVCVATCSRVCPFAVCSSARAHALRCGGGGSAGRSGGVCARTHVCVCTCQY